MLLSGSCLPLKHNYSGCYVWSLSTACNDNGCCCDENCHIWNDCCSDVVDIGCYLVSSSPSILFSPTQIIIHLSLVRQNRSSTFNFYFISMLSVIMLKPAMYIATDSNN